MVRSEGIGVRSTSALVAWWLSSVASITALWSGAKPYVVVLVVDGDPSLSPTLAISRPGWTGTSRRRRRLSKTAKGSKRRCRAADRVARLHHAITLRRATGLHGLTKALTARFDTVALEDLSLVQLTESARGTVAEPGTGVKVKAWFNRHLRWEK